MVAGEERKKAGVDSLRRRGATEVFGFILSHSCEGQTHTDLSWEGNHGSWKNETELVVGTRTGCLPAKPDTSTLFRIYTA